MELLFCEPTIKNKNDVVEFKREFKRIKNKINGSNNMDKIFFYRSWLAYCKKTKLGKFKNRVPDITYLVYDKQDLIGCTQIRLALTENINNGAGHIGYSVRPSLRGRGYATQILAQALLQCKNIGINEVFVSCDSENIASARCIIKNGGELFKIEERASYTLEIYKIST